MQLLVYRTDVRRHIRLTFRPHDAQQASMACIDVDGAV